MGDILRLPVAMRRAGFWMVWSLLMFEGEVFGNQMGAAWRKSDRTIPRSTESVTTYGPSFFRMQPLVVGSIE